MLIEYVETRSKARIDEIQLGGSKEGYVSAEEARKRRNERNRNMSKDKKANLP